MDLLFFGALAFGLLIGWYVYYINRYRKADVQLSDIVTLIGILGGAAITSLFGPSTIQFAGYAIGLAIGFFAYYLALVLLVAKSKDFNSDWFLDGRRKNPPADWGYGDQTQHAMVEEGVED